ncbi:hypothetical protein CH381_24690 [Leptospira sp. mixed culture ATI2-C-A1]|nr:hypothetical protein CH381_24690 [Leptospira sp. mixed culture ATI2-C-A1]
MQGPLPVQELSEVFEVVSLVELLFATSANALAAVVLSVLLVSQDISMKQNKLTMIRFTSKQKIDMYFNFCKNILQIKGFVQKIID